MTPSAWKPVEESATSAWKPVPEGPKAPEDAGFFATIGKDLKDAPKHFMDFISGHPIDSTLQGIRDLTTARKEHQARAKDAYDKGDYKEAFHQLMFSVPIVGPPVGAAVDEINNGQTGQGYAHALEALVPWLAPELTGENLARVGSAARSVPAAVAASDLGVAAKGAVSGMVKAAPEAIEGSLLKYTGIPKLTRGAVEGAKAALAQKVRDVIEATSPPAGNANPVTSFAGSKYQQMPKQYGAPATPAPDPASLQEAVAPAPPAPIVAPTGPASLQEAVAPVAKKPDAAQIARDLAEEMRRSGTIVDNPTPPQPVVPSLNNVSAKADRWANALHQIGITSEDLPHIPVGRLAESQIAQGGVVPGLGNITDALIQKGILEKGETPPATSIPTIIEKLKKLEAAKKKPNAAQIAKDLADEMRKSGTIE